jgi:hypothetical protein
VTKIFGVRTWKEQKCPYSDHLASSSVRGNRIEQRIQNIPTCRYTSLQQVIGHFKNRKKMNEGHPIVDLLDLLVEIAATSPNQSKKEGLCKEPRFTPDTAQSNNVQHQSKTRSAALVKKQKA